MLQIEDKTNDYNRFYHAAGDTVAHMDHAYYVAMVRAVVACVAHLAEPVSALRPTATATARPTATDVPTPAATETPLPIPTGTRSPAPTPTATSTVTPDDRSTVTATATPPVPSVSATAPPTSPTPTVPPAWRIYLPFALSGSI